jgi:hypothetical protein
LISNSTLKFSVSTVGQVKRRGKII